MESELRRAWIYYHICVFLWGFTAIFGRLITLEEVSLVWWRMLFTSAVLLCIPELWRGFRQLKRRHVFRLMGIGILVALHWIAFYGSIKHSTVSVALVCLATTSFFTALIEPLLFRKPFNRKEIFLGLAVVPAIYLIYYFQGNYVTGIILGMLSTIFATLFSVLNKKMVSEVHPFSMTFIELFTGLMFLSLLLPVYFHFRGEAVFIPGSRDTLLLIAMSVFCTALPFTLSLYCLRHISVFNANLLLNLEPVYGIILAMFLFHEYEHLNTGFYAGAAIILVIVFVNQLISSKKTVSQEVIK